MPFNIGNRPLRVAVGCGHANTSGGNQYELKKNREVMSELLKLVSKSKGFDVRSYTPNNGQSNYPGTLDAVVYATVHQWVKAGWVPDIVFEIHHEGTGTPSIRGGFVIYPDSAGLRGRKASGGDFVDVDVQTAGPEMARIITQSIGVPLRGQGIMSERSTGVGGQGWRLGYFGALSDPVFQQNCAVFISEAATYTNPQDKAIMDSPGFASRQARGLLDACAYLAKSRGKWTFPYSIGAGGGSLPPVGFKKGDRVTFDGAYNIRRAWNTDPMFEGKPNVVGVTSTKTVATIIGGPNVNNGYTWWDVRIDGFGTGHVIQDGMIHVKDEPGPEPTPEPGGKLPLEVPELDRYVDVSADTIPATVTATIDGSPYLCVFVGDRVRANADTPRYGSPNTDNPLRNGSNIASGEAFDVRWLLINRKDGDAPLMYRTPWGTFVDAGKTTRIGDVTLS